MEVRGIGEHGYGQTGIPVQSSILYKGVLMCERVTR
jgi:hypothetical protein